MTDWPYGTPFKFGEHDPNWLSTLLQAHSERRLPWELNMRSEIIRCDTCTKEHDAQYYLPKDWITTTQRGKYMEEGDDQHFCSKTCLIKWASIGASAANELPQEALGHVEDCLDSLRTGIMVGLHPKEAVIGPAGIMSQMMIVESVKEDFKKLEEAIKSLRKEQPNGQKD